jgi:signal transduction histidine kinase
VKHLGGTLHLRSQPGGGTLLKVDLPVDASHVRAREIKT